MGQTEDFGLRSPGAAGETTNKTAENATEDGWGAEPGLAGGLAEEPDGRRLATGDARVDVALARLDELEGLPVTEHRAVFEDVHRRLRDVLGELDTGQPRGAGPAASATSQRGR